MRQWIAGRWAALWAFLARLVRAALSLDDRQQRSLMTWGLLGGIVALTAAVVWLVDRNDRHFAGAVEAVQLVIAGGNVDLAKLLAIIMGLLAAAAVLIARGGEMTIKGPGGLEVSARGAGAAKELAKTDLSAVTAAPNPEGEGS